MKKLTLTVGICLLAVTAFGQKKAVNSVKADIKDAKPNIEEARTSIKGALENPETANDAETWYVAGLVEDKAFDLEKTKEYLGQKANEEVMYPALDALYPYFVKADELDQLPDAKGKVKPKFHKDIKSRLLANRPYYINAGNYFYEKNEYAKAYKNWKFYGDILGLPIVDGTPDAVQNDLTASLTTDTLSVKIRYYAAMSAALIPQADDAIVLFEQIKNMGYSEDDVYKRLALLYVEKGDSASLLSTLQQGAERFPTEAYYLLNLIQINVNKGETTQAIAQLNKAIETNPTAQLYDVLGWVYENAQDDNKDIAKAIECTKKALDLDPDYAESLSHLGRLYYNEGVALRLEADNLKEAKAYEAAKQKVNEYFKLAIPYFEKAYQLDNTNRDAIMALRNMYYSFGTPEANAAYEKWDKIYMGE
jgi:tetratricopeptide (TPR) repeat protein